jgi:3-methylcrotonyl-CoA carboxylase alpha subunit
MEMNTRIQVEHPVTEMITGLDLVEWQLRVAAGMPLPLDQAAIQQRGHAIEVRLYAEVPEAGFLPSSGSLRRFDLPPRATGVRIESGIEVGDTVGIDYDPMLAKLIVHAGTRSEAVAALQRALAQVRIGGVGNNVMFLRRLVASGEFIRGEVDIGFIERTPAIINGTQPTADARVLAAAALWTLAHEQRSIAASAASGVWAGSDGWRLNSTLIRTLQFESPAGSAQLTSVAVHYAADGLLLRLADDAAFVRAALQAEGQDQFHLQCGTEGVRVQIEGEADLLRIVLGHDEYQLKWRDPRQPAVEGSAADAGLTAPMPGRIIAHLAAAGTRVSKGAPLLIMEAMKMEHTICAPADGTLRGYHAPVGAQVKEGSELIDFEA